MQTNVSFGMISDILEHSYSYTAKKVSLVKQQLLKQLMDPPTNVTELRIHGYSN